MSDVSIYDSDSPGSRRRPCISLPPPNAYPSTWHPAPYCPLHVNSAEPEVLTRLDDTASTAKSYPRVHIPPYHLHAHNPANMNQYVPMDLESQLRNMIISNNPGAGDTPHREYSHQDNIIAQRTSWRPNQSQRRQQNVQMRGSLNVNPVQTQQHLEHARAELPQNQSVQHALLPHLRRPPHQLSRVPPEERPQQAYQLGDRARDGPQITQSHSYSRPFVQRRQLYVPGTNQLQPNQYKSNSSRAEIANVQDQVRYLDSLAEDEVPKVEISVKEYEEKQQFRMQLELICREVVSNHEMLKDPLFDIETVELKCFGSLSTTFATRASDMDLVVVSPLSEPDLASPESELPRLIEKSLLDLGYGVRLLTRTRVPIIRFCEKPTAELSAFLLEERAKWEKERDERPDPTLPQNRPNNLTEEKGPRNREKRARKYQTTNDDIDQKIPDKPFTDAGALSTQPQSEDKTDVPNKHTIPEESPKSSIQMESEGASHADKTDGDRIRLYRLAMLEGWYEPHERGIIHKYIKAVDHHAVTGARSSHLQEARLALQKLPNVLGRHRSPPEAHLDFPKEGVGIQCDINFSNHLALHNSQLLRCYSLCDERVRIMVLFVKVWSKKRKINTPYHGTLSSYGYVLMVLHYLVNIAEPKVLPNLQLMDLAFTDQESSKFVELDKYNIRFFRNEAAIEDLRRRKGISFNTESVGSLLRGFFRYYAFPPHHGLGGFNWIEDTLSLRTFGGIISKQAKGWTGAKTETVESAGVGSPTKEIRQRYLLAIEDPFETEHNIARTVAHLGIVAIRDEFRRAHRLIERLGVNFNKGPEDLLAEAEDRENLQYRAFGPRPWTDRGPARVRGQGDQAPRTRGGRGGITIAQRNVAGIAKPQEK